MDDSSSSSGSDGSCGRLLDLQGDGDVVIEDRLTGYSWEKDEIDESEPYIHSLPSNFESKSVRDFTSSASSEDEIPLSLGIPVNRRFYSSRSSMNVRHRDCSLVNTMDVDNDDSSTAATGILLVAIVEVMNRFSFPCQSPQVHVRLTSRKLN